MYGPPPIPPGIDRHKPGQPILICPLIAAEKFCLTQIISPIPECRVSAHGITMPEIHSGPRQRHTYFTANPQDLNSNFKRQASGDRSGGWVCANIRPLQFNIRKKTDLRSAQAERRSQVPLYWCLKQCDSLYDGQNPPQKRPRKVA